VFDIPLYRHLFGPDYVENSTEFHHRWIVASAVLGNKEVLQNYPFFLFDDELDANEVMSFWALEGFFFCFYFIIIFFLTFFVVHCGIAPQEDEERVILFWNSYDGSVLLSEPVCDDEQVFFFFFFFFFVILFFRSTHGLYLRTSVILTLLDLLQILWIGFRLMWWRSLCRNSHQKNYVWRLW